MTSATVELSGPLTGQPAAKRTAGGHLARKMPTMRAIEEFHGLPTATCYRCDQKARCEKAHIIDRSAYPVEAPIDVLDGLQNLVPLCVRCHKAQPDFEPGEEGMALAWLDMDAVAYCEADPNHAAFVAEVMAEVMAKHPVTRLTEDDPRYRIVFEWCSAMRPSGVAYAQSAEFEGDPVMDEEQAYWRLLRHWKDPGWLSVFEDARESTPESIPNVDQLRDKQERLAELISAYNSGTLSGSVVFPAVEVLERKIAELKADAS